MTNSTGARLDAWLAGAAWAIALFSALQVALYAYGRDQTLYAVIADGMLAGKMPYRDVWDIKPPGIFLIFTAAEALFGRNMAAVRIIEALGVLGTMVAFRTLARAVGLPAVAGLVGGALAALAHAELGFWHTAQPESFGGMLTAYALAVGAAAWQQHSSPVVTHKLFGAWAIIGALFGLAFLLKPHLAAGAVVCALAFSSAVWRRTRNVGMTVAPWLVIGVSAAIPIAVTCTWVIARGAWPALSYTLFQFTPHYTQLGWTVNPFVLFGLACLQVAFYSTFLLPAGVLAALALPPLAAAERALLAVVSAIVLLHVLGIAVQAKFFPYHAGATLPLVAFVAGLGLYKLWLKVGRLGAPGVLVFTIVCAVLDVSRTPLYQKLRLEDANAEAFWPRSWERVVSFATGKPPREALDAKLYHVVDYDLDDNRTVGRELARRTTADDRVYVWGFEPGVYWFAHRTPASRYVTDQPQRAQWQREQARKQLLDDLRAKEPRVVAVQRGDTMRHVTGDDLDSYAALAQFPELQTLLATRYQFAETLRHFDIYQHR